MKPLLCWRGITWEVLVFAAWFDCWVGWYWDRERRALYVLPVPMVGVRVMRRNW